MNGSSDFLLDLAGAVSDGAPIDWAALSQRADAAATRELLEELLILAQVGEVHRTSGPPRSAAELTTPKAWGPLTLLERIGEGAFGEVFRARDNRLDRDVALKLLRPAGSDQTVPDAAATIEEGRLLARVRHPNVVTVYGAERIDGRIGIWTEFIDGHTLAALVAERGPMPAEEVVAIGTDLCRALAAVHEAGLLHRDIKVQNVMRETGGRIVLMDFGTGHDMGTVATQAGDLSGTPLYLAPELYAGGQATRSSDVYALAVLLFYLLTGRYPVVGRTLGDLVELHRAGRTSTLHDLCPDLPEALVAAIERGLSPDRSQRFDGASDFASSLESSRRALEPTPDTTSLIPSRPAMIALGVLALAAVGASVLGVGLVRHGAAAAPELPLTLDVRPLTFGGDVGGSAVSRDGKVVAFLRNYQSLWLRDTDSGVERQVLSSAGPSRGLVGMTLTPDGTSVDVVENLRRVPYELWRVPLSGGSAWRIAANAFSAPGWSPDGRHMAFVTWRRPAVTESDVSGLTIADADGSNARELASVQAPTFFVRPGFPIGPATNRPAWSPDGRTVAVAGLTMSVPQRATVILVDVTTGAREEIGAVEQVGSSSPAIIEVAWIDQTHLVVNRQAVPDGPYQVWALDTQTRTLVPVTHDLASYRGISITTDRQTAVSTTIEDRDGIWVGGPAGEALSVAVPESAAHPRAASFNAHGDLIYSADTTNGSAIWILRAGATTPRFIAWGTYPKVTPAGDAVVFNDVSSHAGLYRVNLDGSDLVQLLAGPVGAVTFSSDEAIYIDSRSGLQSIWAVSLRGGPPRQLAHRYAFTPKISSDRRRLLFGSASLPNGSKTVIVVCDLPACTHVRELPMPNGANRGTLTWTPDTQGVAFAPNASLVGPHGSENIWVQPLDGGPVRQLTRFDDGRAISNFDWSPDGQRLVLSRTARASDLVWLSRVK